MATPTRPTDTNIDELLLTALVANTIAAARSVRAPRPLRARILPSAVERHDRLRGVLEGLAIAIAVTLNIDHRLTLDIINSHDAVTEPQTPTATTRRLLVDQLLVVAGRQVGPPPSAGATFELVGRR